MTKPLIHSVLRLNLMDNRLFIIPIIFAISILSVLAINPTELSTAYTNEIETEQPPTVINYNLAEQTPDKTGNEGVGVSGWVKITVLDEQGNIKSVHEDHNLIVTQGLGATSDKLFGTTHVSGEATFNYVSVGTSATAVSASHTDCQAQTGSKVQDASVTNSGSNGAVINASWVAVLGSVTIEEVCLTDNGSPATGLLYARQVTGSIVVGATDTVNAEWTITFADSDAS